MRVIEIKESYYEDIHCMLEKIIKYANKISKDLEEKEAGWDHSHSSEHKSDDADNRYTY